MWTAVRQEKVTVVDRGREGGREGGVGAGRPCMYALTGVYEGRRRHVVCIWYLRGFG